MTTTKFIEQKKGCTLSKKMRETIHQACEQILAPSITVLPATAIYIRRTINLLPFLISIQPQSQLQQGLRTHSNLLGPALALLCWKATLQSNPYKLFCRHTGASKSTKRNLKSVRKDSQKIFYKMSNKRGKLIFTIGIAKTKIQLPIQ